MRFGSEFPALQAQGIDGAFRLTGSSRVMTRAVRLPRLGAIRTKEGTEKFRGRILSATVRREVDRWYISLTVETERPNLEPILGPVIGVDLGLNSFAVISDGVHEETVAAPKPLGRSLRLLRRRIKGRGRPSLPGLEHAVASHGSAKQESAVEDSSIG